MTDNQHGPAQGEPTEPRQQAEADAAAETANPAPAAQAAQPAPTAPTAPVAPAHAAVPSTTAQPAPAQPAPQQAAPAQPTGTVYAPGQTPQPYHAPQYSHQAATAPQPGHQPQQPGPYGVQPSQQAAAHHAQAHAQHTQPTQPLPGAHGSVPPAFGGPSGPGGTGAHGSPSQADPGQPKQRRVGLGVAAAIVAAALIGGASGAGISSLVGGDRSGGTVQSSATGTQNIVVNDTDSVNQITAVAAKASPSVVTISVSGGQSAGTGSGIILSEDGYVLTNTHVVTLDGTTGEPTIQVKASDGRLYTADLIGTDPMSDLAVIKLQDASGLQALEFADSDELNVGDVAIAIGAPLGLSGTVTNGIVSALNRSIDVQSSAAPETPDDSQGDQGQSQQPFDFWNFDVPGQEGGQQTQSGGTISIPVIQTDAAINPGNSGGALVDSEGKLIGVNVAILSAGGASAEAGNIGVGFAVPANLAKRVADELIENGSATHGLLGATVTSAQAEEDATNVGALITEVSQGGAAASAGLQAGDVVTEFNGIQITDQTDLTAQVRAQAGGSKAELTYIRGGETSTVEVTLGTFEG